MGLVHAESVRCRWPCGRHTATDRSARRRYRGRSACRRRPTSAPRRFPGWPRNGRRRPSRPAAKLRGDLAGKGIDRHEELSPSRLPVLAIRSDPTAGNQQVDMGVIAQLAVPGVSTDSMPGSAPRCRSRAEILDRRGRDLHQHAVQQLLVARNTARNCEGTVTTA